MTGEHVLELLMTKGIDFVGELHPYDRKQLEDALDKALAEDRESDEDETKAEVKERLEEFASSLKRDFNDWVLDQLAEHSVTGLRDGLVEGFREFVEDALDEEGL